MQPNLAISLISPLSLAFGGMSVITNSKGGVKVALGRLFNLDTPLAVCLTGEYRRKQAITGAMSEIDKLGGMGRTATNV